MANPTIEWNSAAKDYGVVNFQDDSGLVVTFYQKSVINHEESRAKAMRIHHDVVYVKIMRAGEQLNVIDRPAEQQDQHRFRRQYEAFLHNRTQVPEGTPIDLLFPNNPSIADNLRTRGVHTVQQCSQLTAHAIESIGMGAQEYVNRAKKYIEAAQSGESFIKYQEESKKKDQQIKIMNGQIDELRKQVDSLIAKLSSGGVADPVSNTMRAQNTDFDAQSARIESNRTSAKLK